MARFDGVVLLDNCAVNSAIKSGFWKVLVGGYRLETVDEVAREAGSFFRKRADMAELTESFRRVTQHPVDEVARRALVGAIAPLPMDAGERDLWAHAIGRQDRWILCGPDQGSLRAAIRLGLADRLVSLEALLDGVGVKNARLSIEQTEKWLRATLSRLRAERGMP